VANTAAECIWLRQLLGELFCGVTKAMVAFYDNVSPIYMSSNLMHHKWTKHIELDIQFVQECRWELYVLYAPTGEQYADVLTKSLPTLTFEVFRSSLCVLPITHQTARGEGGQFDNCLSVQSAVTTSTNAPHHALARD
jgi:hypothetical protein